MLKLTPEQVKALIVEICYAVEQKIAGAEHGLEYVDWLRFDLQRVSSDAFDRTTSSTVDYKQVAGWLENAQFGRPMPGDLTASLCKKCYRVCWNNLVHVCPNEAQKQETPNQAPVRIDVTVNLPPGMKPDVFRENVLSYIQQLCNNPEGEGDGNVKKLKGSSKLTMISDPGSSMTYLDLSKVDMIIQRDDAVSLIIGGMRSELRNCSQRVSEGLIEAWVNYNRSSK